MSAPEKLYADPESYDGRDLTNLELQNGTFMPVVKEFRFLGSLLTRNCRHAADGTVRIEAAGGAFGALPACLFASRNVAFATKKVVYTGLILSILLYDSECWCLTKKLLR